MSDEPPAGDVEVLSGYEPPPRRPRPSSWKPWVVALVIAFIAAIAWLNVSGGDEPGPISNDPFDPGARTQPLYPGAVGQLLFTVQEEPAAGYLVGETLWSIRLDTGLAEPGPLLLPVGTESGFPARPGVPPGRSFALGPPNSMSGGRLAFLVDVPRGRGGRRFVFGLDVGARLDLPPAPIAEGVSFAFRPNGRLYVLRPEANGAWVVEIVEGPEVARLGPLQESILRLAISGGRVFVVQSSSPYDGVGRYERILMIEDRGARTVLDGYRVLGVGLNARFLVASVGDSESVSLFELGAELVALTGFRPDQIVGWTSDRQHYAAMGRFRGDYGLWFVSWPNTPVFLMMPLDPEAGESVDVVAFEGQGRVAFFVHDLELWGVEIGSERAFKLPLPDDAAREVPSGPLVWVP